MPKYINMISYYTFSLLFLHCEIRRTRQGTFAYRWRFWRAAPSIPSFLFSASNSVLNNKLLIKTKVIQMADWDQKGDIGFYFWGALSNWVLRNEGPNFSGKVILISRFQILRLILDSYDVWIAIMDRQTCWSK